MQFQRYEKYKPSGIDWLGEIPEGWEVKRLKDFGVGIIGITYTPLDTVDSEKEGVLVLRSSNIQNGKISFDDNVYIAKKIPNKLITRNGDILICSRNGSRALIGKNICINRKSEGHTFGAFMTIFRSKSSQFLSFFFNSQLFDYQSGAFMTSTINQLTIGTLHKLTVVAPKDRILQTAIVNYLDQQTTLIDRKIELLNAKKQSYLELKQILIKEVVTGGLDKTTEMKDSEIEWIGQIPKHWELRRGKDLFKYIKKINKQLECKNVLSLTYNGVINKDYNTKAGLNPESYETYQFVDKNDLIFKLIDLENIKTSRVGIVHEHGIMSSAYIRLKSNKSFNKYFYYLYFYYYKINLFNYLGGGVRSTINFSTLLEISIIIPKKSEQIAIANYLDEKTNKIDQIIKKIDENVLALQEFRKTLINDVVTGKVKVL
jgi:type I restriction enzyme S subunit